MKIFRFRTAAAGAVVVASLFFPAAGLRAQTGADTQLTVGIFSRTYVVQAFYRSAAWKNRMVKLVQERNDAAIAGDTAKVDKIDQELGNIQTLARQQAAGEAPLTNIFEALKDEWPAIAQEAKVDIIIDPPVYLKPGSALVDVTSYIVNHLNRQKG